MPTAADSTFTSPLRAANFGESYRFDGKAKVLSFGAYPEATLKMARVRRGPGVLEYCDFDIG